MKLQQDGSLWRGTWRSLSACVVRMSWSDPILNRIFLTGLLVLIMLDEYPLEDFINRVLYAGGSDVCIRIADGGLSDDHPVPVSSEVIALIHHETTTLLHSAPLAKSTLACTTRRFWVRTLAGYGRPFMPEAVGHYVRPS